MEIDIILSELMNTNPALRKKSLMKLEKLGAREAIPHISRLLKNDGVTSIRAEAARILGMIGDISVADTLIDRIISDNEEVAYWASQSLAKFEPVEIIDKIENTIDNKVELSEKTLFFFLQTLRKLGEPSIYILIKLLDSPYWSRRKIVAETLQMIGPKCESALLNNLNHKNPDVRYWICRILGVVGSHDSVEKLKEILFDKNIDVRYAAVRALGDIGSVKAIELLKESLKQGKKDIKVKSIEILGRLGSEVVDSLIDCLDDKSWIVRDKSAACLAKIGKDAIPFLSKAYEKGNEDIRINVVKAMIRIGEDAVQALISALNDSYEPVCNKAVEGLIEYINYSSPQVKITLENSEDKKVKINCLKILAHSKNEEILEIIKKYLDSRDVDIRYEALKTYEKLADGKFDEKLLELLSDNNDDIRKLASKILSSAPNREKVLKILTNSLSDESWVVRRSVAHILGEIGEQAIPSLFEVLKKEDENLRYWAIKALGYIGGEAIDSLIDYLDNESWSMRKNAADALIEVGDAVVKPILRKIEFSTEENENIMYWATFILEKLSDNIIKYLMTALNKTNKNVRKLAVITLGKFNVTEEIYNSIVDCLQDEFMEIRREAVKALGNLNRIEAVETILMFDMDSVEYSIDKINALGKLGDKKVYNYLLTKLYDENWMIKKEAMNSLLYHPEFCKVSDLIKYLDDPVDAVREKAVVLFGKMGATEVVNKLVEMLFVEDFKTEIIEALGLIGGAEAEEAILKFVDSQDQRIRSSVAKALGRIGGKNARDSLYNMINDSFWSVRKQAAEALSTFQELEDKQEEEKIIEKDDYSADLELPSADKYYKIGLKYKKNGDLDRAINAFKMAVNINSDYINAYCKLGLIYEEKGEIEEASSCFLKAKEINPRFAPASIYLGIIYTLQKRIDMALAEFRLAEELAPDGSESKKIAQNLIKKISKR